MTVWAVVPVKRFDRAKSRLAPVLDAASRERVARELFEHVASVLAAPAVVDAVAIVTDSDKAAALAAARGALALPDPEGARTLADRVDFALAEIARRGAAVAVVLMSDLPTLDPEDVRALVRDFGPGALRVAPDERGHHTNALALRLPPPFATAFGDAESFRRHRERAEAAGLSTEIVRRPGLAFDVDTPEDYETLARLKR